MKKIITLFLVCISCSVYSQQDFVISGGEASGSGGSISFSFGQIAVDELNSPSGAMNQGVQLPFEVFFLSVDENFSTIYMTLFPNPAVNNVTLLSDGVDYSNLSYQLHDTNGRLLSANKITGNETVIDLVNFQKATYIITILNKNKTVKHFKLIKNN